MKDFKGAVDLAVGGAATRSAYFEIMPSTSVLSGESNCVTSFGFGWDAV